MTTKFNVGDQVAIIGKVESISVDDKGEKYCIWLTNDEGASRYIAFSSNQVFPASDLRLEEDDLK